MAGRRAAPAGAIESQRDQVVAHPAAGSAPEFRSTDPSTAPPTPTRAEGVKSPVFELHDAPTKGVVQLADGGLKIGADVVKTLRDRAIRETTTTRVPSTPRYMFRDGGGVGVKKGASRWDVLQIETLRNIREQSPLLNAIHSARHHQIKRLSQQWNGRRGEVGWRVVHKDHLEHDSKPPDMIEPYIRTFTEMLRKPSPRYCPTTAQLMGQLEEDYLTINRPVVEKLYSDLDPTLVVGFRAVDGGLIWPTMRFLERWTQDNPRWTLGYERTKLTGDDVLAILSDKLGHDLHTAEYCLVREGVLEAVYEPHRLIVAPDMNRTDIRYAGWPPSYVEQAAEIVLGFLNTWEYNSSFFTRGMMAEIIIGVTGNINDEDIDAFVDMLRAATQGHGKAWQPPVMPLPQDGAITAIPLKTNNKEMGFETWLSLMISLTCGVYRMDPTVINAKPWDGGQGGGLSAPNREKEIALAKEEGLQSDFAHLKCGMLDVLAAEVHPDLRVIAEYGDFDPMKEAQIYEIRSKCEMTRNEVRLAQGMEPQGFWLAPDQYKVATPEQKAAHDENQWNMPADPAFANALNQSRMQKMMAAQGQQPGADGFGGQQPGAADGDGFGQPKEKTPFGAPPAPGGGAPGGAAPSGAAPKPPAPGAMPLPAPKPLPAGNTRPTPSASLQKADGQRTITIVVATEPDPHA
jgi:hypothetical protein